MRGMASTPARTMTSEQTVARIGRRMKVSTNIRNRASGSRLGLDGHAVLQLLEVRDNQLLAFLDAAADDIAVADEVADRNRLLMRDHAAAPCLGDEHEVLPADAIDGDDRHRECRLLGPDEAGGDETPPPAAPRRVLARP